LGWFQKRFSIFERCWNFILCFKHLNVLKWKKLKTTKL
jgi:hypothetical protein